jgi:hypothetical protein
LLREIVKFRTYIESLNAASIAKEVVLARRAERDAELAVIRSNAAAAVTAATVAAADEANANSTEEVEQPEAFDDDLPDDLEDTVNSRDITPRQSAMPAGVIV